jgi:YVTN family beta-propeller protein
MVGGIPTWQPAGSGANHDIFSAAHSDSNASATTSSGSMIYRNGASWDSLALGSSGQVLWVAASGSPYWTSTSSLGLEPAISVLSIAKGGTATTSFATNELLVFNGSYLVGSGFATSSFASSTHLHTGTYQPLDTDLTQLSGFGSTGFAVRTAADTWAQRTLAASTTNRIIILNGDGVAGNPTFDVDESALTLDNIGGFLSVAKGGTGTSTAPGAGQILLGNGTGYDLVGTTSLGLMSSTAIGAGIAGQIPYYIAGGTNLTATSALFISPTGNIGIGTTSPSAKLTVWGTGTSTAYLANFVNSASTTVLSILENGTVTMGNGAFQYDGTTGITSIDNINLGAINFDTDAGQISWIDMPIAATSTGDINSYTAQMDGNPMLTIYGETDGTGGVQNRSVGIGTTTPVATLAVMGEAGSRPIFDVASSTGTSIFRIGANGAITTGTWNGSVIGTGYGGTGTSTLGLNTSIPYSNGSTFAWTATGTNGYALIISGGVPTWSSTSPGAAHPLLGAQHLDTNSGATPATGDLLTFTGGAWDRLPASTTGRVLWMNGSEPAWTATSSLGFEPAFSILSVSKGGTGSSTLTSNGVLYGNGTGAIQATAEGANGYVLWSVNGTPTWTSTSSLGLGTGVGTVSSSTQGYVAYYDANGTTVSGTSSLFIASNGYVGVGTTSPSALLTIGNNNQFTVDSSGYIVAPSIRIGSTYNIDNGGLYVSSTARGGINSGGQTPSGAYSWSINSGDSGSYNDGFINFNTSGVERMRIIANGNVGIGTTSPLASLDVYGSAILSGANRYLNFGTATGTGGYGFFDNAGVMQWKNASGDWTNFSTSTGSVIGGTAGQVAYYGSNGDEVSGTSTVFINPSTGFVGIGTTTPGVKLTVVSDTGSQLRLAYDATKYADFTVNSAGELNISINDAVSGSTVVIGDNSPEDVGLVLAGSSSTFHLGVDDITDSFRIGTSTNIGSSSALTILPDGNVGIGTSQPSTQLHIQGVTNQVLEIESTGAGNHAQLMLKSGASTGRSYITSDTSGSSIYFTNTGGAYIAQIDTTNSGIAIGSGVGYAQTTNSAPTNGLIIQGNVGIGTTSPSAMLTVGATSSQQFLVNSLGVVTGGTWQGSPIGVAYGGTGTSTIPSYGQLLMGNNSNGYDLVGTSSLGLMGATAIGSGNTGYIPYYSATGTSLTATSALFIAENGNIGIGTTNPDYKLETNGDLNVANNGSLRMNDLEVITAGGGSIRTNDNGTAAQPSFSFISDPDNGVFRATTNEIGFSTYGLERLRINQGGLVGIGTTSPLALLDVYGSAILSGSNRYLNFGTATGTSGYGFFDNAGVMQFKNASGNWTNFSTSTGSVLGGTAGQIAYYGTGGDVVSGTSSLFIAPTGFVGIGTTTPGAKLTILSDTGSQLRLAYDGLNYTDFIVGSDGKFTIDTNSSSSRGSLITIGDNSAEDVGLFFAGSSTTYHLALDNTDGALKIGTSTTIGSSTVLTILENGNVGIGTTTPAYLLTVGNNNQFRVTSAGDVVAAGTVTALNDLVVNNDVYNSAGNLRLSSVDNVYITADYDNNLSSGAIIFGHDDFSSPVELMRLSEAGNLGIGTSSPSAMLTVGATSSQQFLVNSLGVVTGGTWQGSPVGVAYGGTGTSTTPTYGQLLMGNNASGYDLVGTSSLGLMGATAIGSGNTGYIPYYSATGTNLTATSALFIAENGNVGIGTTDPGSIYRLNVDGSAYVSNYLTAADITIGGNNGIVFNGSTGYAQIATINTNNLALGTGGGWRMYINSSGDVGIGTTSPLALLDVYGSAILSGSSRYLNFGTATGTSGYGFFDNAGVMQWKNASGAWTNFSTSTGAVSVGTAGQIAYYGTGGDVVSGTSSLFIAPTGFVGIGTTTPGSQLTVVSTLGPQLRLAYDGSKYVDFTVAADGQFTISPTGYTGGSIMTIGNNLSENVGMVFAGSSTPFYLALDNADGALKIGTSTTIGSSTILTILENGNVGIGDTNPSGLLSVKNGYGQMLVDSDLNVSITPRISGEGVFTIYDNGNDVNQILQIDTATGYGTIRLDGRMAIGNSYMLGTPPTDGLIVEGNVGIGTTSPSSRLTVYGDAFLEGSNRYLNFGTATGTGGYGFYDNGGTLQYKNSGGSWTAFSTSTGAVASGLQGQVAYYNTNGNTVSGTSSLFIAPSGNIGIHSTSSLLGNLDIRQISNGNDIIYGRRATDTSPTGHFLRFYNAAGTTELMSLSAQSGMIDLNIDEANGYSAGVNFYGGGGNSGSITIDYISGSPLDISGDSGVHFSAVGNHNLTFQTNGEDRMIIDGSGQVGIGTSSPSAKLTVWGTGTSTAYLANFVNSASTTVLSMLENGTVTMGDGAFQYDGTTGVTSIDSLDLGSMNFDTDAGLVTWVDMPVATTTAGIVNGYIAQLDGNPMLTVYGETDGTGGVHYKSVGIGTTTPLATLAVMGEAGSRPAFDVASSTGASMLRVLANGNVGIGTASPGYDLDVNGDVNLSNLHFGPSGQIKDSANTTLVMFGGTTNFYNGLDVITGNLLVDAGNLGIGTSSPSARLTVWGAGTGSSTLANFVNSASTSLLSILENGNVGVGTATPVVRFQVNAADNGTIARFQMTSLGRLDIAAKGVGLSDEAPRLNFVSSNDVIQASIIPGGGSQGFTNLYSTGNFIIDPGGADNWVGVGFDGGAADPTAKLEIDGNGGTLDLFKVSSNADAATQGDRFVIKNNGFTGIGTTSPSARLTVWGTGTTTALLANFVNSASTTVLSMLENGTVTMGNGAFQYDGTTGITSIDSIEIGTISFDTDAGVVPWTDMTISTTTAGIVNSYTAQLDGNPMLTIYGETDGAGGVRNTAIGIGTTSPIAKLDVNGNMILEGANRYLNFGTATGTGGYGFYDNGGTLQYKNSGGSWTSFSTSTGNVSSALQGQVAFYNAAGNTVSGTSTLFITQAGNVGIGTTTPTESLSVVGSISNLASSQSGIRQISTASVNTNPSSIYVSGRYAYVAKDNNDLAVVDISNPVSPIQIATTSVGSIPYSIYVSGRYAYVSNAMGGSISVVDISNPKLPTQVALAVVSGAPGSIYVSGHYAYVAIAAAASISVVDVTNPMTPKEIANTPIDSQPNSIFVSGRYAYTANNGGTISVVDISNPVSPIQIATTSVGSSPQSIYVSGRYAYVANKTSNTLSIVDISNPFAPTQVATTSVGANPQSVFVSGRYAYVANTASSSISIIDISSSTKPTQITTVTVGTSPYSIYVSGRYAYVANSGSANISVVDISGLETTSLLAGSADIGNLQVRNDIILNGQLQVFGGGVFGAGGIQSQGGLAITATNSISSLMGQVAIGTSSPSSHLTVWGDGTGSNALVNFVNSASTTLFTVLENGNIGIGTTTPSHKLQVYDTSSTGDAVQITNYNGNNNEAPALLTLTHRTTASVSDGFGSSIAFVNYPDALGESTFAGSISAQQQGASDEISLVFSSGYQNSGNEVMRLTPNGRVAIGTTSPSAKLTVWGTGTSTGYLANFVNSASTTVLSMLENGTVTMGDGAFQYDGTTGVTSIDSIDLGSMNFDTDSGIITWIDMPVATTTADIIQSYTAKLDGNPLLTIYGATDGAGGIKNRSVGIGTTTPLALLALQASTSSRPLFDIASTSGASLVRVDKDGKLGIGTTSPVALLSIYDDGGATNHDILVIATGTAGKVFRVDSAGQVFADNGTLGSPADYAEYFKTSDANLVSGEAVCIDVAATNTVKRCRGAADNDVIGIVSTKPLITGNYKPEYVNNPAYTVVAMLGQIPAKVSAENGPVRPGDSLTPAKQLGYIARAQAGDPTVGVALETLETGIGEIKVLISRRNKSMTVEQVEQSVTDRIAAMKIEDEVRIMIANSVAALNLDKTVSGLVSAGLAPLDTRLSASLDELSGQLVNTRGDLTLLAQQVAGLELQITNYKLQIDDEISRLSGQVASSTLLSSNSINIDAFGNIKLGNNIIVATTTDSTSTPVVVGDVAIVEIDALSPATALVVRQAGEGNIAEFHGPDVSVMTVEGGGEVSVVGSLNVDGRILVCSGGVCPSGLDDTVDSTLGDVGVEGKVVAGAYESYCADGFVWVPGSSKYGTMPGFCVMDHIARQATDAAGQAKLVSDASSTPWVNISQGEAGLACQGLGDNYHLISENEWLTIAENAIRIGDNDIDLATAGLQLATTPTSTALVMSNGGLIYDITGTISQWTDQTITKTGLPALANSTPEAVGSWQEYYNVDDYRGLNINPPYYYTAAQNGIGQILLGTGDANLRGFIRGYNGLYSLDLSNAPTIQSPVVGFRCAK